ncbi:hypothetical protein SDC9_210967 [bioreactor metagenome]|uniref:Uncharacterized protein n=1 Tax=bioreactor metagenome TaxID=1076179 RepID=A0A645JJ15_9ZZZZ
MQSFISNTTGSTFTTGFMQGKFQIEFSDRHHAVIFIQHDHSPRTHHRTCCDQVIIVDRRIQMLFPQATSRRSTGLNCFKLFPILDTTANIEDDFPQRCSHWHFNQPHIVDFTGKGKDLRSF